MAAKDGEAGDAPRHVYLIDGSGFIFRAFHALPPMTRSDGTPINAVLGFTNMLWKILRETDADYLAVIFDTSRKTFRSEIYPAYKAHRPEAPEELIPQFPLIRDATRAFNLPSIELVGFEADDLIASYTRAAREVGAKVTIVSSDKDLMQLVEDEDVIMYDFFKNRDVGPAEVHERFGVGPEKVVDVQALAGDSSDNVPGVPGIGVKTAAQLIHEYGDLDSLLANAAQIKQPKRRENLIEFTEQARISRQLVTLRADAPLPEPLEALKRHEPDVEVLLGFLREQELKSVIARVEGQMGNGGGTSKPGTPENDPSAAPSYSLVQSRASLDAAIDAAWAAGCVALAAITDRPDPETAEIIGLALASSAGTGHYVPIGHGMGELALDEQNTQLDLAEVLGALKPLLEDRSVLKLGQDIKQIVRLLARHEIALAPIDDAMVISYVLDGGLHGHALDDLAKIHLDVTPVALADLVGTGRNKIALADVPPASLCGFAAERANLTLRLYALLRPRLVTERMTTVHERIERPLMTVLAHMESVGIRADSATLKALSADFEARIKKFETEIHGLAGHPFTIGSPKQLGEVLFDEMGLQSGKKGKSGAYSTGADVLEGLAAQGHDLPARVLDWRQLTKLKSTYTDALIGHINARTGRVHTTFSMIAANTGRLSSNDPNLQNIPVRTEEGRKIRHAFVAEPGFKLLSADYSQIELRILAHIADVATLKDAFRDGVDIHALTASQVFGVPLDGMDPMVRRSAKAINFGIIYGISPFGLARQLGVAQGEAKTYIEAYFERYPGIRDYMERAKKDARAHGFVTTLFGRHCHLPGINDKNPAHRSFSERAAINAPIQGSAADIIKLAMLPMERGLADAGLKGRMLLQVHDELVFEVPDDEIEATSALVKRVMEGAATLSVPLTVDVGAAQNWADAH